MSSSASSLLAKENRALLLRELHALAGVVPIGAFLIVHIWTNTKAMQGRAVFEATARYLQGLPLLFVAELVFIAVPLLFHALYGMKLLWEARAGSGRGLQGPLGQEPPGSELVGTVMATKLQRLTGAFALVFIAYHLGHIRIPMIAGSIAPEDLFTTLSAALSSTGVLGIPLTPLAYAFGVVVCVFHFANGVHLYVIRRRKLSDSARRLTSAFALALGVVLTFAGVSTVVFFATGARWLFW